MKKIKRSLTARQLVLSISAVLSFLIFLVISAVISGLSHNQLSQQMAERWSEKKDVSQISCFFSTNTAMNPDSIEAFRHSLDSALQEASIIQESPNAGARLWTDAYSADGRIILQNDKTKLEADAVGIGGDFFLFHPQHLLYGSLFSGNDLMQDYCVIDEDAAWQLFGSNNVVGMTVYIGNVPHIISGVIRREQGGLSEAAGLDSTLVYVSYETLSTLGSSNGINHYEIVMPNPVSKYAYGYVKDKIGVNEREMEVIENTTRYGLLERLKIIASFGKRSMNSKAIIYPYWENIARGYEDILALLTLFALLFLLFPVIVGLIYLIKWWKRKNWTMKSVYDTIKDKGERQVEFLREKRMILRKKRRRNKEKGEQLDD